VTMRTSVAGVSAPTATALVVVVIGKAVFGRRVPAGNARVWEDAFWPQGSLVCLVEGMTRYRRMPRSA